MTQESDVRITPPWVMALVRELAGDRLLVDVCTEWDNPIGAERFYTEADDGLASPWAETARDVLRCTYWGNVPFSRGQVALWAAKFAREAQIGLEGLLLTQADVSTEWYALIRDNADARCHLNKRVQFLEPDGRGGYQPCKGGAKFGTQICYMGPRRRRFARIFGAHGEILPGWGPQERDHG